MASQALHGKIRIVSSLTPTNANARITTNAVRTRALLGSTNTRGSRCCNNNAASAALLQRWNNNSTSLQQQSIVLVQAPSSSALSSSSAAYANTTTCTYDMKRANDIKLQLRCFSSSTQQPPPPPSSKEHENDDDQTKQQTSITSTNNNKKQQKQEEVSYSKTIYELSKAKLSALVVSTTTFGFLAAAPSITPTSSYYTTLAAASIGTALCSSSASTFNQIFEQDRDAKMKRTSQRPLVTKRVIETPGAVTLAISTGISGATTLYYGTDQITTLLGVGNIVLYSGVYTYMKPRSEWNTWVGAIVGAIPPVMGYTAATSGIGLYDIEALLLGSTLFLWQFPHFFALSWMHRQDYARGGFQMVSTNDNTSGDRTSRLITRYTYYMSLLPFVSTFTGVTGSMFAVEGLALNGYAIWVAKKFEWDRSNANARKVFLTSLWYLPCWMMLFLLHSTKWKEGAEEITTTTTSSEDSTGTGDRNTQQELNVYLKQKMGEMRNKGKELCVHEQIIHNTTSSSTTTTTPSSSSSSEKRMNATDSCPIALGKKKAQQQHAAVTTNTSGQATTEETS